MSLSTLFSIWNDSNLITRSGLLTYLVRAVLLTYCAAHKKCCVREMFSAPTGQGSCQVRPYAGIMPHSFQSKSHAMLQRNTNVAFAKCSKCATMGQCCRSATVLQKCRSRFVLCAISGFNQRRWSLLTISIKTKCKIEVKKRSEKTNDFN
jgi:hypothetical protein